MQHTTHQALILQSAPSISIPEVGAVEQIGLLGVVGLLLLKEALAWFRTKESAEEALVSALVADLRTTQKQLLDKLFELHTAQHRDLAELRSEMRALCDRIDKKL